MDVVLLLLVIVGIALIAVPRLQRRRARPARARRSRGRRMRRAKRAPATAAVASPVATWTPAANGDYAEAWDDDLGWEGEEPAPPAAEEPAPEREPDRQAWERWRAEHTPPDEPEAPVYGLGYGYGANQPFPAFPEPGPAPSGELPSVARWRERQAPGEDWVDDDGLGWEGESAQPATLFHDQRHDADTAPTRGFAPAPGRDEPAPTRAAPRGDEPAPAARPLVAPAEGDRTTAFVAPGEDAAGERAPLEQATSAPVVGGGGAPLGATLGAAPAPAPARQPPGAGGGGSTRSCSWRSTPRPGCSSWWP